MHFGLQNANLGKMSPFSNIKLFRIFSDYLKWSSEPKRWKTIKKKIGPIVIQKTKKLAKNMLRWVLKIKPILIKWLNKNTKKSLPISTYMASVPLQTIKIHFKWS